MSNPISESARYFLKHNHHESAPDLFHSPNGPTDGGSGHDTSLLEEARDRWKRVLSRLSLTADPALATPDIEESSTHHLLLDSSTIITCSTSQPRPPSSGSRLWYTNNRIDDSSNRMSSMYHGQQKFYQHSQLDPRTDDRLPSTVDLTGTNDSDSSAQTLEEDGEDEGYFVHPFKRKEEEDEPRIHHVQTRPPRRLTRMSLDETQTSNVAARDHWGITLDKIKLIATIPGLAIGAASRTGSTRDDEEAAVGGSKLPSRDVALMPSANFSLAPYYPPAFEPLFIALSRDESGRKLPPVMPSLITVSITDSEYSKSLGQWAFRTELQYGDIKWVIRRTIVDFTALHYTLKLKSNLSEHVPSPPPFPELIGSILDSARMTIGLDRVTGEDYRLNNDGAEGGESERKEVALARRIALTQYLRNLLARSHILLSYDLCEFFEISAVSIVQDMGWKGKEGYLEHKEKTVQPTCCGVWKSHRWHKEWVLLRDSYIAFCYSIADSTPSDVLLLDKTFRVRMTEPKVIGSYHMTLSTQNRQIEIKGSRREVEEWMESIKKVKQNSPWVKAHRFGSFAPVRHHAKVKWFVDGENHFNAVAEAILSAKSEIYITDWWLTPELYLRRPPEKNQEFRIDRLLQRKAEEGVKIYIIVYKEMSLALTIDSAHTKQSLQSLHENILVQRHPDRRPFDSRDSIFFWSHHEKIVVVDNRLAFIGGLDLCFGRYDTHAHRLADYPAKGHPFQIFPGQDYSSPRVKDFTNVAQHNVTLVDREQIPRMPWHDMSCAVVGPIARDSARLFIERWNFLKSTKSMHRPHVPFLMPKGEYVAQRDESKFEGSCRVQLLRSAANWSSGIEREHSIYNAYVATIEQAHHYIYIENQFFISATGEDKIIRNKIGQAIVERIKRAHYKKEKFKVFIIIPLIPAFEGDLTTGDSMAARGVMHFQYVSMSRGGASICEKLREAGIEPSEYIDWYSLRNWDKISPRIPKTSPSNVDTAAAVTGTTTSGPNSGLASQDAPLLNESSAKPASDSNTEDVEDDRDHYVSELVYIHDKIMIVDDRIVLIGSANINDRSLLGNRDSEVAIYIEDTDMIPSFMNGKSYQAAKFAHTLRIQLWKEHLGLLDFKDWDLLMDQEDDDLLQTRVSNGIGHDTTGPGSDKFSLGGLTSNDEDIREIELNEAVRIIDRMSRTRSVYERFSSGPHGHHLKEAAALDPLTDRCYYHIWRKTAETNTLVYRDLFRCVPDNTVHTFEQHRKFVPDNVPYGHIADPTRPASEIREQLSLVRGHLVKFPTEYLKDEALMNVFESMAPMMIFS
ncbi:hypothetical protein BX666DRAFT_2027051 [Dichotomocladium elegans]|nr:hypothetical protein BX666DRAFT_2027051 [Dichotomocladium elegans]